MESYIELRCHPTLSASLPERFTINSIMFKLKVSSTNAASKQVKAVVTLDGGS